MVSKNHRDPVYKSQNDQATNSIDFYALNINRAVANAAAMFQQHPSGCSTRAVAWFCTEMPYAYQGALNQGVGVHPQLIGDLMKANFVNRTASIAGEYQSEMFPTKERRLIAEHYYPELNSTHDWKDVIEYQGCFRKRAAAYQKGSAMTGGPASKFQLVAH